MTKSKGDLKRIAGEMRDYAIQHPRTRSDVDINQFRRGLTGGLRIVLFVDLNHRWHLSAYRLGVYPSSKEIDVLKRDFNVPADALLEKNRLPGTAPEERQWHIIRLKWIEIEQRPLFEVGPAKLEKYF